MAGQAKGVDLGRTDLTLRCSILLSYGGQAIPFEINEKLSFFAFFLTNNQEWMQNVHLTVAENYQDITEGVGK